MTTAAPDSKVLFRVVSSSGETYVETLWATRISEDHYKLDNSPFYAYGVSWQDVVYAPVEPSEGMPTFHKIASKSGNRTVRIAFEQEAEAGNLSDAILQELIKLGCSYEGANGKYISINIPPAAALEPVCGFLTKKQVTWEHADPTYEEYTGRSD